MWRASRPTGKDLDEYKALLAQKLVKPTKMDLCVANADGTEARQVTYLPGASFAPYFFPDGKRILFSSNFVEPARAASSTSARSTSTARTSSGSRYAAGFDGFPVFSPDGKTLAFSSNRRDVTKTANGDVYRVTGAPAGEHDTNVFLADWVDQPARRAGTRRPRRRAAEPPIGSPATSQYLADDAREGRGIGTKGLEAAGRLVAGAARRRSAPSRACRAASGARRSTSRPR